ncbi:MAG: hypothetical protein CMK32_09765 [Porticoccaceae bacterium]|nr:hypothetical protein [Porticoccaceae bacterium]
MSYSNAKLTADDLHRVMVAESPRLDGPGRKAGRPLVTPKNTARKCYERDEHPDGTVSVLKSQYGIFFPNPMGCRGLKPANSRRSNRLYYQAREKARMASVG